MSETYGSTRLKSRRTLIYLALSLMTASGISGLLWSLLGDVGPPVPVTVVVLTLLTLVPLLLSRWVREMGLATRPRQGILAVAFVLLGLSVVASGFYNDYGLFGATWMNRSVSDELSRDLALNQATSLVLVVVCWWLGLTLGDMRLTPANLSRYFYVCILVLTSPSVFFVSDVSQGLSWLYFMFLFTSLVMLGLGRVEEAARRSQDRGSPFTFYWLTQVGLFAGVLLGLVGIAQALKLAYGFGLILVAMGPVVTVLAYPLFYVGARFIGFGLRLAVASGAAEPPEAPDMATAGAAVSQSYEPSNAQSLCASLVFLVFLLAVALGAVYAIRRWREMMQDYERKERVAMPSLGERVAEALEERIERLRFNLPGVGRLRRRLAVRSIRRIYAALVALGAERGYSRPAARTPYEHLATLKRAFPGCEAQVERITAAYVGAHYGQVPETRQALREIKAAWEHVRETSRRIAPTPSQRVVSAADAGGGHHV
jgi:hypothetical protein